MQNLYDITGKVTDINTVLVPREEYQTLKADAERLDYLESLATYESRGFMGGTHQLIFSRDFDEPNANFRAAIDAAKEQQS